MERYYTVGRVSSHRRYQNAMEGQQGLSAINCLMGLLKRCKENIQGIKNHATGAAWFYVTA